MKREQAMCWSLAAALGAGCAPSQPGPVEPVEPVAPAAAPAEPRAAERPFDLVAHGETRSDPFYWLRERESPEVRSYLEAENRYLEAVLAPAAPLRERLFEELAGRLAPADQTAPWRQGDWLYYRRFEPGGDYPLACRRAGSMEGPEEVLLDGNQLARGHAFFSLARFEPSPSGRYVAYAVDTVGRRFYTLRIRDSTTGETLPDTIEATTGEVEWAADDRTLFYLRQDPETLRADRAFRHRLGADPRGDEVVYREEDETFSLSLAKTTSERYLVLCSRQTLATECRVLPSDRPAAEFEIVEPRRRGHEYWLDHQAGRDGGRFLFLTNDGARNFRLAAAPVASPRRQSWSELVPGREDVLLADLRAFTGRIALLERSGGLPRLRLLDAGGRELRTLAFDEPAYALELDERSEHGGPLRFRYSSMTTPWTVYEEDFETAARTLVHQERVLGGFDAAAYRTERFAAPARDGAEVPVTLLYRRGTPRDGTAPLLLEGYGAYGYDNEPAFDANILSLADRGFVVGIAHVRGGQELGRAWYEAGRQRAKLNTFHDFIDVAEYLKRERWADPRRTYAVGGSAGGLLIGAVLNLRPELFDGAIAAVPFVDVVTTMLDPTIPLTTGEYDEWGDPNDPRDYHFLLGYSPYDNVAAKPYPHLLVTTGFHDSQVQYWEPAKWVAKLRTLRTDRSKWLLLHTDFDAGHGGASGRYRRLRDKALQYAFLLELAGRPR